MCSLFLLQHLQRGDIDRDKAILELQILTVNRSYGTRNSEGN